MGVLHFLLYIILKGLYLAELDNYYYKQILPGVNNLPIYLIVPLHTFLVDLLVPDLLFQSVHQFEDGNMY